MFEVWVSFKTSGGFGFEFGFDLPCRALSALSQAVPTEGPQQTRPLNASLRSPCFPRSCPRLWIQNLRRWVVRNEFWRFYEVTKGLWQTLLTEWYALDGFDYHILILCQFMHTVNAYFFLAYPLQSYNRFNCFNGHKNTQTLLLAKTSDVNKYVIFWNKRLNILSKACLFYKWLLPSMYCHWNYTDPHKNVNLSKIHYKLFTMYVKRGFIVTINFQNDVKHMGGGSYIRKNKPNLVC